MNKYIAGLGLMLAACGDYDGEYFVEEEEIDQVSEGLSVKPSSEYTHGVGSGPSMQKCTVASGAGSGFSCMVPSRTTVRFKLVGTDDFSEPERLEMSWKAMIRRAYNLDPLHPGQLSGPFTYIEENTPNTWVVFTRGNCPGDAQGSDMNAFVCINYNGFSTLTESLPGTYKKTTGLVTVTLDLDAMYLRAPPPFTGTRYDEHFHQLLEHAGHMAAMLPIGMGTQQSGSPTSPYPWSINAVERPANPGGSKYNFQNYTTKEKCIMQSFSSMSQTTFTLQSGTCTN